MRICTVTGNKEKRSKDYAQTVSRRSKVYHRSASEV